MAQSIKKLSFFSNGLIFLLTFPIFFYSCKGCKKTEDNTKKTTEKQWATNLPSFNADTAYFFVQKQTNFGPRVTGSKASTQCAEMLVKTLKRFAPQVSVQTGKVRTFDGKDLNINNIIASFNPDKKARIFLSSHWDSRPFADYDPDAANHHKPIIGANDGASGVGVLVEIARILSQKLPEIGVDIILFDAEDYGAPEWEKNQSEDTWCLGSQFWAKNPHVVGYSARYGILLDMVGAADARFTFEGTSMYYASDVMKRIWETASHAGFGAYFVPEETGALTDDHLYINQIIQIPTIDIIHRTNDTESGFFPYWHTQKDDISCIDKTTLKAVGQTLLTVIYNEN
ncbi:MAG: M28 family peptidase [Lentimicrobiaceae bacterium]|nr:M28 family peptidase [Lentimicrobiaceae bacterium]